MKKSSLTLILAILVANTIALGGCQFGKCLSCTGAADTSTCAACVGGSPKATISNSAVFDCSGTAIDGCLVNLTEGKCKVCERTRILSYDRTSCLTPEAALVTIPSDPRCLAIVITLNGGETTVSVCFCKGKSVFARTGDAPDCNTNETPIT
jgi:hypothetical protein